ncbi:ArsR/SmtB family transcription factor [Pseudonocardia hispaniensis]|uniref:ArsR/SmtB family transcription factor n=1 Tax=Pseudonocardia hispaniensis TaxID=904933 RepID=A0ABW1J3W2_9PSEU
MGADLAFDALADPVRRRILGILAEHDEVRAGDLATRVTSVGRTAVSSHLRILRSAGLVTERRDGRYRLYSVDPSGSARDVLALLHQLFQTGLSEVRTAGDVAGSEEGGVEAQDRTA